MITKADPAPSAPPEDMEAEAIAASSREEATADIRQHLDQHLQQNPNSSYVTWIATLHPENAEVTIDPRFKIPGNPWLTVYEDGTSNFHTTGLPVAEAVSVDQTPSNLNAEQNIQMRPGGVVSICIGGTLAIASIATAFSLELLSLIFYTSTAMCSLMTPSLEELSFFTAIPKIIWWFLMQTLFFTFRLIDVLVLFISILTVELLAGVSWFLCWFFTFAPEVALFWHQLTRRLAHLTRWAFRHPFEGCGTKRSPFSTKTTADGIGDSEKAQVVAIEAHHVTVLEEA